MTAGTMTLREAAIELLRVGGPKHYEKLTEEILAKGLASSSGKTPAASLNAMIAVDIKRNGAKSEFVRVRPGVSAQFRAIVVWECSTSPGGSSMAENLLFSPATLGRLDLPNRMVMAPMTRCRAEDNEATRLMGEYYAQRASAGLIICRVARGSLPPPAPTEPYLCRSHTALRDDGL